MKLAEYYLGDSRLTLIPAEHLCEAGMSDELAALLAEYRDWSPEQLCFFDAAFSCYWRRSEDLARKTATWVPPRRRNLALIRDPLSVHPYAQLLNTSTWLLYESDFDPVSSHSEFAAYLLAHGDCMALTGEVTSAAAQTAAWWFERTAEECASFAQAAACSPRPDARGFRAIATAIPWLRRLRHETLCPPESDSGHRSIPGSGLLVPASLEQKPPALASDWKQSASAALAAYRNHWRSPDTEALQALLAWIAADAPPLLITGAHGRILWEPVRTQQLRALRAELESADGTALRAITADLELIAEHTRTFLDALVEPTGLAPPAADTLEIGYTYLHPERGLLAYNLHEPGMERLQGPALPYAAAMLGARAWHEWAHAADAAGWIPLTVTPQRHAELTAALADGLEAMVAAAPNAIRSVTAGDLEKLTGDKTAGAALAELLVKRMPDYRANLLARRFMSMEERETYVRHNIRTLGPEYRPAQLWRMLIRYLYEFQYLDPASGLTTMHDPSAYFIYSTGFYHDFFAAGVIDEKRFRELAGDVSRLCACYAVDEARFRLP